MIKIDRQLKLKYIAYSLERLIFNRHFKEIDEALMYRQAHWQKAKNA